MINYGDQISEEFKDPEYIVLIKLLEHIDKKGEGSIAEYILDFCEINSYHIEDVAELIKNNKNIKDLLKEDCVYKGILRVKNPLVKIDDW